RFGTGRWGTILWVQRCNSPEPILAGLPARTPEAEMSQREGSTFSIECPYATQPGDKQPKAWCRVRNARCELVVWTLASTQYRYSDKARQGHITIQDDNRTVSITMSHLQAEDSGIYSCVYSSNYVPLKTISLNVYKGDSQLIYLPLTHTSPHTPPYMMPHTVLQDPHPPRPQHPGDPQCPRGQPAWWHISCGAPVCWGCWEFPSGWGLLLRALIWHAAQCHWSAGCTDAMKLRMHVNTSMHRCQPW
uniref:Ig-like domain-containing protein n=1 Tax=Meleagris gallopavo TaxID=9103 RepID=A0A803YN50_MELGA